VPNGSDSGFRYARALILAHVRPQHRRRGQCENGDRKDHAPTHACEQDREPARCNHEHCRSEIGLFRDQQGGHEHDQRHRDHLHEGRRQPPLVHEPRNHHRHGKLHELRRLKGHDAEVEPTLRAFADLAFHHDGEQQPHSQKKRPWRPHPQVARRYLSQQEKCAQA
jgi:hypothetical protein